MPGYKRKSSFRSPSAKRMRRPTRVYRRRRGVSGKSTIAKIAKAVQMKTCETKMSNQYTDTVQELFHNKAYYASNLLATTQGVRDPSGTAQASSNRIGDEVYAKGLSLKFFLQNNVKNQNVTYRIVVFKYNTLEPPLDDTYFWCGTDGAGGNMNRCLDYPQTERVKIIKSMFFNPNFEANYAPGPAALIKNKTVSCYVPLGNRKVKYNGDGSPLARYTDIGFMVLAYDSTITTEITIIADLQWQSRFYFKDP